MSKNVKCCLFFAKYLRGQMTLTIGEENEQLFFKIILKKSH